MFIVVESMQPSLLEILEAAQHFEIQIFIKLCIFFKVKFNQ